MTPPAAAASTPRFSSFVYGHSLPALDDPAEAYHEASSWYEATQPDETPRAGEVERNPALAEATGRAGRQLDHLPIVPLADPLPLDGSLGEALAGRRSSNAFTGMPLERRELATLVGAAVGHAGAPRGRRPAPSAGALYPIDVYAIAVRCDGVPRGVYYVDASRGGLVRMRSLDSLDGVREAFVRVRGDQSSLVLALGASFWRCRFKYGLRAYRFALLEAGHIAQNVLLAAGALRRRATPVGGFYDERMNALLELNGVDEATVYVVAVG